MTKKILIVEDSEFYGKLLKRSISSKLGFQVIWCKSFKETEQAMVDTDNILLAILDYHLPDAMEGEIIELCRNRHIPSIVMTATFSPDIQEVIWSKKVIDYVIKEGAHSISYIIEQIDRFNKNQHIGILVVDDSSVSRTHLRQLLKIHQFKVYEAVDGNEALKVLDANLDIKLALVDYQMPVCDGFEFTKRAREKYPLERLAIIGISAIGSHSMMIKFIKYGANDFITKPFVSELLYCRVNQNIKVIEYFETLREVALLDPLTEIHNRRYLYESGELLFNNAVRNGNYISVAMIDIDDFKLVNDTYGHEAGDIVIKSIAQVLKRSIRKSDIVVRYGGEEFCILGNNMDPKEILSLFDNLRKKIEEYEFTYDGRKFTVTASFGLCIEKKNTLTDMINNADNNLYRAKELGKNRVHL